MTASLTLTRIVDDGWSFPWRCSVIYDSNMKMFYLYDKRTEKYILVDVSGDNYYPTIEVRNRKETEDWIKNRFNEGHKMYWADSTPYVVFKPANITLKEAEKLSGRKTTVKKTVRKVRRA